MCDIEDDNFPNCKGVSECPARKKPLVFEVGKTYVDRAGNHYRCLATDMSNASSVLFRTIGGGTAYRLTNGNVSKLDPSPRDIIAEYVPPVEIEVAVYQYDSGAYGAAVIADYNRSKMKVIEAGPFYKGTYKITLENKP